MGVRGSGNTVGVRGVGLTIEGEGGIGVEGIPGRGTPTNEPWAGAFRGSVLIERDCTVRGDLIVLGAKSAVVRHPDGSDRALYAIESPVSWFEDLGRATLTDGRAWVALDDDFAAVTQPSDDYHVFLTPEGETEGLRVGERTPTGFEVRELRGGRNTLPFSYRIALRRPDVDRDRLAHVDLRPSAAAADPAVARADPAEQGPRSGWPT